MARENTVSKCQDRIDAACGLAWEYGQIDGGHHKMWVIDQMLRALLADRYDAWVADYCRGSDGNEYEWDKGIAP